MPIAKQYDKTSKPQVSGDAQQRLMVDARGESVLMHRHAWLEASDRF